MQSVIWSAAMAALVVSFAWADSAHAQSRPVGDIRLTELRCEYLNDPLGLTEASPRLGWIMQAERRGVRQTAYQILVATSPEALAAERGDLWDSGKVTSDASAQIVYAGKPLTARQACWWTVRAWDEKGTPTAWSQPAKWEMGLLRPDDWQAKWVEMKPVALSGDIVVNKAVYVTADGQTSKDVTSVVTAAVRDHGLDLTANNATLGGDPAPGKVKRLRVQYTHDGASHDAEVDENQPIRLPPRPLPYARRGFTINQPVKQARLFVTALGLYEARLNGRRVGDRTLAPDWTDYTKRLQYQTYDVTDLVKTGENVISAVAAAGWYAGRIGLGGYQVWGKSPAVRAQLEVTLADGTVQRVLTDEAWKLAASPILASDFMLGESYDARRELAGWDVPGFDDSSWKAATTRTESVPLEGSNYEPVRPLKELPVRHVTEPKPGRYTFDFGQNMVGVVRLNVSLPAGTKLTIRHAEMLNPDGTLYLENLRAATSTDTYVCRGGGAETWQPKFTFHGFRYVEVTGLPTKPDAAMLTGVVLGSDTPTTGEFTCSNPDINQLQSNIEWGQRGNFLSIPTDCPQRDERLGWMGDAQVFIRTAAYNADVSAFFTKWMNDVVDAANPDGRFPEVAPRRPGDRFLSGGSPAWGDAGVICPWAVYQVYGDKRILDRHYPAMVRWVEWCRRESTGLIRDKNRGQDFGDWLSIEDDTDKELIGTAFFAYSTHLLAETARVIGKDEDATKYAELFQRIRAAFTDRYVAADGRIKGDTQTAYLMALKFDLLPAAARPKAVEHLVANIKRKKGHLSTGFIGVSYLLPVLTEGGRADVAYELLMQTSFPSWLFSVKNGATTIWERWDGWTDTKGFQSPSMNSFNHYSLGSCGEWLFGTVAGIRLDPSVPGYARFEIRPTPGGGLTHAEATYRSPRGLIVSGWEIKDGRLTLRVTVPANAVARVLVPTGDVASVREGEQALDGVDGVRVIETTPAGVLLEVGSGVYAFTGRAAPSPQSVK